MKHIVSLFLLIVLFLSLRVHAHPHNWIDVQTEFVLNSEGQLIALKQQWTFDVYYSTIKLADVMNEYKHRQNGLDDLVKEMAKNLAGYQYFSELNIDNQPIALPSPEDSLMTSIFNKGQEQLILTMNFTLEHPYSLKQSMLSWRVFDPTYYIDMKHHKLSQVLIHQQKGTDC